MDEMDVRWLHMDIAQMELMSRAGYDVEKHGNAVYLLDRAIDDAYLRALMASRMTDGMFLLMASALQGLASDEEATDEYLRMLLS